MPITTGLISYKLIHQASSTTINSYIHDLEIIDINNNEITYDNLNFTILGGNQAIIYATPSTNNPSSTKLNADLTSPLVGVWSFESITSNSNGTNNINWNNTSLSSNEKVELFSFVSDVRIKSIKYSTISGFEGQYTSHLK